MTMNSWPRQERAAVATHSDEATTPRSFAAPPREADPRGGPDRESRAARHVGWWIGGVIGTLAAAGICIGSLALDRPSLLGLGLVLLVPYVIMLAAPGWLSRAARRAMADMDPMPLGRNERPPDRWPLA